MNEVEWVGSQNFWMEGVTIRRRWDGLDELSGTYFASTQTAISPGNSCPAPYTQFKARDVEVLVEPEGMAELRISGIGILGTKGGRRLSASWSFNQEGFDEGVEVWLRTDKTGLTIGQQWTIQAGMYATDITWDELDVDSDYQRATVKYRGILAAKDQKVYLNGQELSEGQLASRIKSHLGDAPAGQRKVMLKAHSDCTAAKFEPVIEAISQAGGELVHVLEDKKKQ